MPRKKLSDKLVQSVQSPKTGRLTLTDTLEAGLDLRVTETDARSWSVRVWTGPADKRVQRRITLGHPRERDGFPVLSLAAARQGARDIKQAAAEGRPLVPGDGLKGAMTWGALTENYLKSIEGKKRPSTVQQLTRILRHDDLAAWRERPAVSITADDVRAVRDHIHDDRGSPVQSTCVLRAISGLGTWATEEGKLNVSPARDVKARGKANERDRILSDDEIAIFWRVCDAIGYPYGKIGQLLLLTATRLCETAQLPWDELNLDFRVWYIQRTKPGRPLTLHLSRPALAILRELAEQRANVPALAASPFVFTSAKGGRIESFTRMRELFSEGMLKETGKAPDFTAHDLRRTAATTMARLGAAPHTVELILNHAKRETIGGPVARIYNQFEYESERAEALDKLGEFITALASPRVVPLRRA
jgi:integrase